MNTTGITGFAEESRDSVRIYNREGEEIIYNIPTKNAEGHGGADKRLRDMLFRGITEDPLKQMAGLRAGMMSIGIGMAANVSMLENRRVYLDEFYKNEKEKC